jgi:hypothetical protein
VIGRPRAVGGAVVLVALLAIGFLPLFDGPGYEQAIASGLIVPTATTIAASLDAFEDRHTLRPLAPLSLVLRGLATGALFAALALLAAWIHVLRVGPCAPLSGSLAFLLGPGIGALLAGAGASAIALIVGRVFAPSRARRRWASWIAGLWPLSTALVGVFLFWATPAIFAFDPFVGFFSGTLYDEVVDAWGPLLTYRAGTLLTLGAILAFAASAGRPDVAAIDGRGAAMNGRGKLAALGALLAFGSLTLVAYGPQLGHRTSARWIRDQLGASRVGPRCEVVYPASTSEEEAALMLRDCEEEIRAVEARFGARGPEMIVAFFFKDGEQKRRLMGAADTYIAKPWRAEVYLQVASYPHPVLGHELAHVIAGASAPGPFHVAGHLGGLIANPGLIEGVAVASSPERDELTPAQWARAMKELGLLPKLGRIFSLGFLGENSSIAYTVAGSFVSFQLEQGRSAALRAWYGGASFEQAFGRSFAQAEEEWRASLERVSLPDAALVVAKARFDRPAIWGRRCPHVVERLRDEAEQCQSEGRIDEADAKYGWLLKLDELDPSARLERAKIARARGDSDGFLRQLAALAADPHVPSNWRARTLEAEGDERLRRGELDRAYAAYDAATKLVVDEDRSRNLEVRRWLAGAPDRAARFGRLLVPRVDKRDEAVPAMLELARFVGAGEGAPLDRAFARYLLARRLYDARAFDDARAMLSMPEAELAGLDAITPRLRREIGRLSVLMACLTPAEGRRARVAEAMAIFDAAPKGNEGRASDLRRAAARCVQ